MRENRPLPIRLMHYDARWRQEFSQTRSSLLHACEGWLAQVEHVGSTAIPGMIARPTIDLLAGVTKSDELTDSCRRIEGLHFRLSGPYPWANPSSVLTKPRHLLPGQAEPTHRIFLTVIGSPIWEQMIALRDHLRQFPEVALQYEEAKMKHWRSSDGDVDAYESAKAIFLTHLLDQIDAATGRTLD